MGLSGDSGYLGYRMSTAARDGLMDPNAVRLVGSGMVDGVDLARDGVAKGKEFYKSATGKHKK